MYFGRQVLEQGHCRYFERQILEQEREHCKYFGLQVLKQEKEHCSQIEVRVEEQVHYMYSGGEGQEQVAMMGRCNQFEEGHNWTQWTFGDQGHCNYFEGKFEESMGHYNQIEVGVHGIVLMLHRLLTALSMMKQERQECYNYHLHEQQHAHLQKLLL